jgi:hypothetical protein
LPGGYVISGQGSALPVHARGGISSENGLDGILYQEIMKKNRMVDKVWRFLVILIALSTLLWLVAPFARF